MKSLELAVLSLVPFIMVLGNSMLIPVLPAIQRAVARSDSGVGLLITAFSLVAGVTIPFTGFLSDRIGRKKLIAPALVTYGAGGLICGLASILAARPFGLLLAGRAVQGLGAGGTYQLAMALVGDAEQSRRRARSLGILESANGLGKVVSPVAGAALGLISWFAVFFAYGFLALPAAAAVWFLVREPPRRQSAPPLSHYTRVLTRTFRDKGVCLLAALGAGMTVLFVLFGALATYSDLLEARFGIRGFAKGLILAVPVTAMASVSYATGIMLQRILTRIAKPALLAGLALVAAGLAGAPLTSAHRPWLVLMSAIGAGTGLVLPSLNLLFTSSVPEQERGLVTAVYGTARFWAVAMGPPAFGLAERVGLPLVFWVVAGLALGVAAVVAVWLDTGRVLPAQLKGRAAETPAARPAQASATAQRPVPGTAGSTAQEAAPEFHQDTGDAGGDEGASGHPP
ncbi:MAG: MFS transporter [Bacillota bacterium]